MTEKEHPYRAHPASTVLRPRGATPVGMGMIVNPDSILRRFVEALPVGDGFIVTIIDRWWSRALPSDPQGPGLGRFHLASIPAVLEEPRLHQTVTFHTTMSIEQLRNAFFEECEVAVAGSAGRAEPRVF